MSWEKGGVKAGEFLQITGQGALCFEARFFVQAEYTSAHQQPLFAVLAEEHSLTTGSSNAFTATGQCVLIRLDLGRLRRATAPC
jgi:hypothetical protein